MQKLNGKISINFWKKNSYFILSPLQKVACYIAIPIAAFLLFGATDFKKLNNENLINFILSILIFIVFFIFLFYTFRFKIPIRLMKAFCELTQINENKTVIHISVEWGKDFAEQIFNGNKKVEISYKDIKKYMIVNEAILCFGTADQIILIIPNLDTDNKTIIDFLLSKNHYIKQRRKLL